MVVALMGGVLSLGAFMGFVVLFGLSTRNAILLLTQIKIASSAESELVARNCLRCGARPIFADCYECLRCCGWHFCR